MERDTSGSLMIKQKMPPQIQKINIKCRLANYRFRVVFLSNFNVLNQQFTSYYVYLNILYFMDIPWNPLFN